MKLTPLALAGLLAAGYLLYRSTPAAAALPKPRTPGSKPAAKRPAAKPAATRTAPAVAPAVPTSVPWPKGQAAAAELAVLKRPQTAPTGREATPAFAVKREDGSSPQTATAAIIARERAPFDASYWRPVPAPTAVERQHAITMLRDPSWKLGAIAYDGPRTWSGRRQFRAVMHGPKRAVEIWEPKPPFV